MFQTLKANDLVQLMVLILLAVIFGYFYANTEARNRIWLKTYPIRAQLSNHRLTCTPNSPTWLANTLTNQTLYGSAPSNQIAYIDPHGTLAHCQNGYTGEYPLLSPPVTPNTRFRYASVTKLWTADAILTLIKQGKLRLDTKLADLLPQIHNPKDPRINDITIADLLLHRAGFDRYSLAGQDMFGIGKDICPNRLDELNQITLGFTPNSKMSYSNLGYCLLGEVIARQYQQPYTDVIRANYGLDRTTLRFIGNTAMPDEIFYNYVETGITGIADIYTAFDYHGLASAAGLSGNAIDLAQQVKTMLAKPAPNITTFADIPCDPTKWEDCYGYAMFSYQPSLGQPKIYVRSGALLGLSSLVVVTEDGAVIALLSNGRNAYSSPKQTVERIYQQLYGRSKT